MKTAAITNSSGNTAAVPASGRAAKNGQKAAAFSFSSVDKVQMKKFGRRIQAILLGLLKFCILVGIAYIILGPLISMLSSSFFTEKDLYNPVVILFPVEGTLQNYADTYRVMQYPRTLLTTVAYVASLTFIQVIVCSMAGYGFARFDFPFKNVLFACVILTIVLPTDTLMLPWYTEFRNFDILGILHLTTGHGVNLLTSPVPMYIMTLFACGLRSGLFIYIFNQFFRGLPKEIEEAAFVDGAGALYTYFRIMLINAMPSVLTVSIFSMVWQYNDTFYARLFGISNRLLMSMRISTVQETISNSKKILDSSVTQLYLYAGIIMMLVPVIVIYCLLQKRFVEGVERSGIVG